MGSILDTIRSVKEKFPSVNIKIIVDLLVCGFDKSVPFIDNSKLNKYDFFNTLMNCDRDCNNCKEVFQAVT